MTRVIALRSLDEAQDVAQEWAHLHADGASDIFTSPAWCLASWRALPDLGGPSLLIALEDAGMLLGVVPLTNGPLGTTWAASPLGDEHDLRVRGDQPSQEAVSALLRSVPWMVESGQTMLTDVRPGGLLARAATSRRGCPAPVVCLNDPDPEFGALGCLPGWSCKRRRALRSARRRLEESGTVTVQRLADPASLAAALPAFARTRLASWTARGRLAELPVMDRHPGFPEFLTYTGSSLAAQGQCLLARLNLDGEPLAQALFFRFPGADLLYMSTYQLSAARYSPSHLLLAESAQRAVADGVRVLELGRGDEPYKFVLGAQARYLRNVVLPPVP
ncbi:MAG: GNAT family N-acetyltransferase [Actinomycetota bacterium]|nr:GNAT family N-acetyltransferase [Actinomycetota bacterium]